MTEEEIFDMKELAYSIMILYLSDNVLRRVNDIDDVAELWTKLETMYMSRSLTNKIYLEEILFGFKIDPSKGLEDNIDEFNAICMELANMGDLVEKISL